MSTSLIGRRITAIRPLTLEELAEEGWTTSHRPVEALILDDGSKIYAARDYEGNGPGVLFGRDPTGPIHVHVPSTFVTPPIKPSKKRTKGANIGG